MAVVYQDGQEAYIILTYCTTQLSHSPGQCSIVPKNIGEEVALQAI